MSPNFCSRCGCQRDESDNFCRRCGQALNASLPVVQDYKPLVHRQYLPAPLIGSMAVLALGTGAEWLARRLAGSAARAAGRALIGRSDSRTARRNSAESAHVEEMLYVRRVALRR